MDVNFAIRVEAWASALGYTVDSTGHVEARILRALRQIAGVPGYGGLMHFNNEVLVLLSQIAANGGGTGSSVLGLLTAAAISAGSTYEMTTANHPNKTGYLQLKKVTNFPTSRTIAAASPEFGWTWINRTGVFDSANDNTTNAGASTWDFNTTSVDWFSGTRTAPFRYRSVNLAAGQSVIIVSRVKSTAQRNFEFAGFMVLDLGTQTNWTRLMVGYSGTLGGLRVACTDSSVGPTDVATVTATEVNTNGIWLKLVWTGTSYSAFYSTANQSTPPSTWTLLKRGTTTSSWGAATGANAIGIGPTAFNVNTSGDFIAQWLYWDVQIIDQTSNVVSFEWGTELFSTAGTEQLVGEVDFGTDVSLDQTVLRQVLTDATNARPQDGATVTFSVVGGSSSGPASSTYYAAGSVVVSGSYRYWRVYAKITSATGVEQGSVKLPLLLPPSVA